MESEACAMQSQLYLSWSFFAMKKIC